MPRIASVPLPSAQAGSSAVPLPASDIERQIVADMSATNTVKHINTLATEPRVAGSEAFLKSAQYVVDAATSFGWDARIEAVSMQGRSGSDDAGAAAAQLFNVVAERSGTAPDGERRVVVAGAHLDSVRRSPGGNDNASGSSTLLEAARVLSSHPTKDDMRFLWFDGEEAGLLGSAAYVRAHRSETPNMRVMLNADMVASPNGSPGFSLGRRTNHSAAEQLLAVTERNGVPMKEFTTRHNYSDHASFDAAGVPAVDFGVDVDTVGRDDPNYHTSRDTAQNISSALLEQYGDAFALAAYNFANPATPPAAPTSPTAAPAPSAA